GRLDGGLKARQGLAKMAIERDDQGDAGGDEKKKLRPAGFVQGAGAGQEPGGDGGGQAGEQQIPGAKGEQLLRGGKRSVAGHRELQGARIEDGSGRSRPDRADIWKDTRSRSPG